MHRAIRLAAALALPLWAGCQCNETNLTFDFPEPEAPVEPSPAPVQFGEWASVDTAPDGVQLTMSYFDRAATGVGFAVGTPEAGDDDVATVTWRHERVDGYASSELIDDSDDVGRYTSQRTAPDGTVWVAYHDQTHERLMVAHRRGPDDWEAPVAVEGGGGRWASLGLNPIGDPIIAHVDASTAEVKISRLLDGAWRTDVVFTGRPQDDLDDEGEPIVRPAGVSHTRFLASDGVETIALYNEARGSLVVLEGSGNVFEATEVDRSADVGDWPSLQRAGDDLVVAYHDRDNEDLKVATRVSGTWSVEVVDEGRLRGADTEVFLRDGEVAIVYFDGYDNDARVATRQGTSWVLDRVGAEDNAVGFHNEVVRAAGRYWAVSYSYTSRTPYVKAL